MMNHRRRNDDPFYHRSKPSTSASYTVYTTKLSSDQEPDDTLPSIVEAGQMNAYMDEYLEGINTANHEGRALPTSTHDEDLAELFNETDDMKDIQQALQQQNMSSFGKFRSQRSKQKRAAAARSRYQRMSENERKEYNHRRRLRQLGVDPNASEEDQEQVRTQLKEANAKKAEAARQRYHRMTPEQKKEYNHRRTEAFRRRRLEEEQLLSTPAGRISQEALAKANQIMVRNARKAESARLRYQRMTPDQRKVYNLKRSGTKKTRESRGPDEGYEDYQNNLMDTIHASSNGMNDEAMSHLDDRSSEEPEEDIEIDETTSQEHLANVINDVAHPPDELGIFAQMENEVLRRTKVANATIMKQNYQQSNNAIVGGIQYDMAPSSPETLADAEILANLASIMDQHPQPLRQNAETVAPIQRSSETQVIDEKALHDMVRTGRDHNGNPVEVRTVDGIAINSIEDLRNVSHGQTVLITQRVVEEKPIVFHNDLDPSAPSTSSSTTTTMIQNNHISSNHYSADVPDEFDYAEYDEQDLSLVAGIVVDAELQEKIRTTRARRAERARSRYHRMSEEKRREQNARRALALRESRARDEELLKIADSTPPSQIDPDTRKAIQDAQLRRSRRAEQARAKYRKMTDEERKTYNQARDVHRRMKKDSEATETTESTMPTPQYDEPSSSEQPSSPPPDQVEASNFFY